MKRKGSHNVVRILLLSVIRVQHVQMRTSHRLLISLASPPALPTPPPQLSYTLSAATATSLVEEIILQGFQQAFIFYTLNTCVKRVVLLRSNFFFSIQSIILDLVGIQGYILVLWFVCC